MPDGAPMRSIIINADDYAMDAGVDAAILDLAGRGAISAASAMVLSPRWPEAARASKDAAPISWGLHLDLTSSFATGDPAASPLPVLIAKAQARLLEPEALRRMVNRQLALFESSRGAAPAFVDGHQHVHHLPVVRDVLIGLLEARYGQDAKKIGLRICTARRWRGAKASIIARLGARALSQLASERGHPVNSDFAGVYDFDPSASLKTLWARWMSATEGPLPLIMCHVAAGGASERNDPIRKARTQEYKWLASEDFAALQKRLALRPQGWPPA